MMKNNNNNHKKRKLCPTTSHFPSLFLPITVRFSLLPLPCIALVILSLLLVALPTDIYAKYILLSVEDFHMKVAGFEHQVSICPEGDLPETWAPGSQAVYSIQVSNQSANGISQTGQTYNIEVITAGELPLRYTLFEESDWEGNWNELAAFTESPQENTHIFQTDKMQLPGEVPTEHAYKLVVSWEESYTPEPACSETMETASHEMENESTDTEDFIRINVNLEQMD